MITKIELPEAGWRKSSYSGGEGNCVEMAVLNTAIAIRDSKNPHQTALLFTPGGFDTFLRSLTRTA